jgi:hypothetical protein
VKRLKKNVLQNVVLFCGDETGQTSTATTVIQLWGGLRHWAHESLPLWRVDGTVVRSLWWDLE